MYTAIFLDLDDTIFSFEKCGRAALKAACAACRIPYGEEVFAVFQRIDDPLWDRQKKGELSVSQVLEIRACQFTSAFDRPEMNGLFRDSFTENLSLQAETEPFALEALHCLSQTFRIYAASNGILKMQTARLKKAGLLDFFSGLYVSDDIGYEKPDARFFSECIKRCGTPAREILMVGDSLPADVAGAARSGIDCCWYNPRRQKLPRDYTPKYVIQNLLQLCELLEK